MSKLSTMERHERARNILDVWQCLCEHSGVAPEEILSAIAMRKQPMSNDVAIVTQALSGPTMNRSKLAMEWSES